MLQVDELDFRLNDDPLEVKLGTNFEVSTFAILTVGTYLPLPYYQQFEGILYPSGLCAANKHLIKQSVMIADRTIRDYHC